MATTGESSSIPAKNDKPVIVRVKRKAFQYCLDAFWLEIKERPLKRPLVDFANLSLSSSSSKVEEQKSRKVLVQHVETVTTSEVTADILQSLVSNSADEVESKGQSAEPRRRFNTGNKQEQLLAKARQSQEAASKNARFEQIWKSRRDTTEYVHDDAVGDMCKLYDIVRIDEEKSNRLQKDKFPEVDDDCKMMATFLPLLREVIPSAAKEVEADILDRLYGGAPQDNYVYDYYAVKDNRGILEENTASPFPLVQVQDDSDYYDGPDDSEYATDDSNAENNPLNDYPDEESTDENLETESGSSEDSSLKEEEANTSADGISFADEEEQDDWYGYLEEEDGFFEFGEVEEMNADDGFRDEA